MLFLFRPAKRYDSPGSSGTESGESILSPTSKKNKKIYHAEPPSPPPFPLPQPGCSGVQRASTSHAPEEPQPNGSGINTALNQQTKQTRSPSSQPANLPQGASNACPTRVAIPTNVAAVAVTGTRMYTCIVMFTCGQYFA